MNFVLAGAAARGFRPGDPDWINLGQGQPEIGDLPGAPPRITIVTLDPGDHAYGPVNGAPALREAVAAHYNRLYRSGPAAAGTRPRTSRSSPAAARRSTGPSPRSAHVDVGYLLPDYAAYDDILDRNAPRISPVPCPPPATRSRRRRRRRAAALLLSNPRNPTGEVIAGDDLRAPGRRLRTPPGRALLVDEFYSHYVYEPRPRGRFGPAARPVSAAEHVERRRRRPRPV